MRILVSSLLVVLLLVMVFWQPEIGAAQTIINNVSTRASSSGGSSQSSVYVKTVINGETVTDFQKIEHSTGSASVEVKIKNEVNTKTGERQDIKNTVILDSQSEPETNLNQELSIESVDAPATTSTETERRRSSSAIEQNKDTSQDSQKNLGWWFKELLISLNNFWQGFFDRLKNIFIKV